jgi:DegV family protein with EDD domain
MTKVAVVTDVVGCIPGHILAKYDIGVAPLTLIIDGKKYLDGIDITPERMWSMFYDIKTFSSGAPAPGLFAELFQKAARNSRDIVCVTLSAAISATYSSAVQAKEMVQAETPGLNIEVIDSKNCLGAEGFVALEAARAAMSGAPLEAVVQAAGALIPRASFLKALHSPKYVMRTGRAPESVIQNATASARPIIGMARGKGTIEKLGVADTEEETLETLAGLVKNLTDRDKPLHVMVHYTISKEIGEELKRLLESRFNCAETYISPMSPVIGGSSGPGLGLGFYS